MRGGTSCSIARPVLAGLGVEAHQGKAALAVPWEKREILSSKGLEVDAKLEVASLAPSMGFYF